MKHMRGLLLAVSSLLLIVWAWGAQAQENEPCAGSDLVARLPLNSVGRVIESGGSNNVRREASASAEKVGVLPAGGTFTVLEGPVCADDATWLRVDDGAGLTGWTVEIVDDEYALELVSLPTPAEAVFEPGPVDYEGVHFNVSLDSVDRIEARFSDEEQSGVDEFPPALIFDFIYDRGGKTGSLGVIRVMSAQSIDNENFLSIPQLKAALTEPSQHEIPLSLRSLISISNLIFIIQPQIIPLGNGTAQRSLPLRALDPVLSPSDLDYEVHGLTSDGRYYIQANFRISYNHASIFSNHPENPTQWDIDTYHNKIKTELSAALPKDFSADPTEFDALLATLVVDPLALESAVAEADMTATMLAATMQALPPEMQTATMSAVSLPTSETPTCGTRASRLRVGDLGQQILDGETLRVRQSPNGDPIADTRLFYEDVVRIEEGPVCIEGLNWWRVSAMDGSWTGWIAEGDAAEYFMQRVASTATPAAPVDGISGPVNPPGCRARSQRLRIGDLGEQILDGETLRVRQSPNGDPIADTRLFYEDLVRVEEGPVCIEDANWWRVSAMDGSWTGWIAEGDAEEYFMKRIASTSTPAPSATMFVATPTQVYDCIYVPTSFEHALSDPYADSYWEYFLVPGRAYSAIYQFEDAAGATWYMLAYESQLTGRDDGIGPTYNRSAWVTSAIGSQCGLLPYYR